MTGDNQYVTQKVAHDVGLPADRIVTGNQVDTMDDAALAYPAEHGAIFARVSPEQKNRVILGLKARGHVVGYIGDGINDAPSLHTADVGISVMNGVDVAKDAAKIILLEKDLAVLNEGVIEGRRCFANVMIWLFHASTNAALFRTGWFVESLATQTLVVSVIRTAGNPFKSRPSGRLLGGVVGVSLAGAVLTYTPIGAVLGFTPLPLPLLGAISLLALTYLLLVHLVKTWFYRRHALL
jgi:magnesium-transporting ATPase (P-type)